MVQWLNPVFGQTAHTLGFKEYNLKNLCKEIDDMLKEITSENDYHVYSNPILKFDKILSIGLKANAFGHLLPIYSSKRIEIITQIYSHIDKK